MRLPALPVRQIALGAALFLAAGPSTALAQRGTDEIRTGVETVSEYPWYADAVIPALITLVIGGLLIAVSPDGTRRRTDRALESPGPALVYGVLSLVVVIGASFLLAMTGIGLIIAFPLLAVYVVFLLVASEFGYLAVGRLAAGGWLPALVVATVVSALTGIVPIIGLIAGFVIGMIGVGTVVEEVV
ncbi:hypothetical protein [Natrinema sp. SYSU A 869]|uniref:hypothetical protein n=1 Tax=Natrinema sp. SYSU A 869 TaxID=2871694 RepID=UPI001CA3E7D4|nr:hypothetical protein [Natrinema sp. SYSU A 869]